MPHNDQSIFPWEESGSMGLAVDVTREGDIAAEVMYEKDMTKIQEQTLYVGPSVLRKRFYIAMGFCVAIIGVLVARAFWMQGMQHEKFLALADRNRLRTQIIVPARGMVRDRTGKVLADNVSTFDVSVVPADLPADEAQRQEMLGQIARISGVSIADLTDGLFSGVDPQQSLTLVRDIPHANAVALKIRLSDAPAVQIDVGQKRRYGLSAELQSFSHVLGYVGMISPDQYTELKTAGYRKTDTVGKAGIEAAYENVLRGVSGERITEVDAHGRPSRVVHDSPSIAGKDVILSMDADLQRAAESALRKGLETAKVAHGAVVVLDPRDGTILAAVSWPAYDNNMFSGHVSSTQYAALLNDPGTPFLARAWAGTYPSGSTIKPAYAVAALAEGIITAQTNILSSGGLRIGDSFFPDWKAGGHGMTNVREAIAWSVNTFFYTICGGYGDLKGLGVTKMDKWLEVFGFGERTGLDIPGEVAGLLPTPEWAEARRKTVWRLGDTYNLSIGQGDFLVTPLQIANMTAEIANGGFRVKPHLVLGSDIGLGERLAPETAVKTVRAGMRDTVVYGSGRALAGLPFTVAGKTGTAQWRNDRPNHAWFTAFAPYESPEVVVTVLLEEGVEGSVSAVPVAKEVLMAWQRTVAQSTSTEAAR